MKKLKVILIISVLGLLVSMAIMLPGVFIGILPMVIVGTTFMFLSGVSIIVFTSILIYRKSHDKGPSFVRVKANSGSVFVDCKNNILTYKDCEINLAEIISYDLVDNSQKVLKSGFGEAVVGGVLFGGAGAIAGAYAGKREKVKEKCKFFIKTTNVQNAGIVINLSLDNGFKLYETIDLLIKRIKQNLEAKHNG